MCEWIGRNFVCGSGNKVCTYAFFVCSFICNMYYVICVEIY